LRQYLSEHPVDLLHAHYRRGSLLSRRLQATFHMPLLYTVHLSHVSMAWPRSVFSDFSDHTHVASEMALRWLVDELHLQPHNITLIPHGIDPEQYPLADAAARAAARKSLGLSPDDRVAVYVGRLEHPKNEDWMIDLAQASRLQLPNLRVLLVGEGPNEDRLRRRIAHLGLEQRVKLLGYRQPLPIYQAADALLLASLREGFSLVTAEAMSVGVPVLRTNTAGTPELIIENVTGRATPIEHDAFLSAAMDFLSDPVKLSRMGRTAARHVRENFTFQRQFSQTMELYHHLVDTRTPRP
jgi:glycosyltransferase involved in cell wall biosynthesis